MKAKGHWIKGAAQAALAALALALGAAPALADTAVLKVSATILPHASLQVLAQPAAVVVTAQDIARGYVEVPALARVAVRNNTPAYMLQFAGEGEFVRQLRVSGLGPEVQMGAGGGGVRLSTPGRGMNQSLLEMRFRIELAEGTREGVYPWPVQLSVTPL